jgi:molecular chaperone HtpG
MSQQVEIMKFHTEIYQLMAPTINAFMKTKKFFQELISNCSDICDKIRYKSLKISDALGEQKEIKIDILSDKENKLFNVTYAGIEMTAAQLISNLGTIARSITRKFMKVIEEGTDLSLIGQFYVGFFSIFGFRRNFCHIKT